MVANLTDAEGSTIRRRKADARLPFFSAWVLVYWASTLSCVCCGLHR